MATKNNKQSGSNPLNMVDEEWNQEAADLLAGMFSFPVDQQAIPALVIVQGQSAGIPDYRKHIGEIYNTVTKEFFTELEIVIIGNNTPRAVLPYPFSPDAPQLCASVDGVHPYKKYIGTEITAMSDYDEQTVVIPDDCEACPLFDNPMCTKMFRYFGITPHDNLIFTMRLKRSAMDAAKQLNFWLNQLAQRGKYFTFVMKTKELPSKQGGSYFVPEFVAGKDATEWLQEAFKLNRLLEDRIRRVSQAQVDPNEE